MTAKRLYNVYAWYDCGPSKLVAKEVHMAEACRIQDGYLNRIDGKWDAFLIACDEDPNYRPEDLD